MKIYSKTNDYYDGIARSWQSDPKRVFVRENEIIKLNKKTQFLPNKYKFPQGVYERTIDGKKDFTIDAKCSLLFFCGEVYPFFELDLRYHGYGMSYDHSDVFFFYDDESFNEKLNKYSNGKKYYKYRYNGYFSSKSNEEFIKESKVNHVQNKKAHLELNCAYFTIDQNRKLTKYPVLKDIGFQKIMSDFECWQKIEQYLTNDLVPPDMVEHAVTDDIKAESHGFNQYSFRKDKELK
jgi:hypothetical protein